MKIILPTYRKEVLVFDKMESMLVSIGKLTMKIVQMCVA